MTRNQTLHEFLIPMMASALGVRRYLELGVHQNETIGRVAGALPPDSVLVAVDLHEPASRVKGVAYRIMATGDYLDSHAALDAPFQMVFIDADHSARSVLLDFEAVWPHVADEGLVLLHDSNPDTEADTAPGLCGDAWRAARYLSTKYESVTLPYHPGLTIVRKRVRWGPSPAPVDNPRT